MFYVYEGVYVCASEDANFMRVGLHIWIYIKINAMGYDVILSRKIEVGNKFYLGKANLHSKIDGSKFLKKV